ncbi:MAG: hypothetical protein IJU37_13200 [Desulfovibrio sp.]|nr:hypothetical protein [Desulfovibrio sp.]
MEKEYLLVPVDAKASLLLDFGAAGIRPVLHAIEEALTWIRDVKKTASYNVISMLNNGLRMTVTIRASLMEHNANQENVYYGSMESLSEHCGVKPKSGWTQVLNDENNGFTLLPNGSVRLTAFVPQAAGGGAPLSAEIPAGFFVNIQKYIDGK